MRYKFWYKLLYYWCFEKIPLGSGLTVPFLIGFEREYGTNVNFSTDDLLKEFKNLDNGYIISIRYCDNIGAYVCCLDEKYFVSESKYFRSFGSLFFNKADYSEKADFDDILKDFRDRYMGIISDKGYSYNEGGWTKFNKDDLNVFNKM
ncbi:hypothetical protein [Tenacibaculum maritimum]|uniref:hypothetical protein n=2 Tax=Tenacibaculum maritimum TaxID=107401 RepID=UPI0012E5E57B|nr:hypothetical protein [Tenacibaculum maritimum]CAA0183006.1 hypothetical protein TFA04_20007 [Tenacibaculum maritimum]CAA0183503.1 conserved hypothetical protein [Tenacibaculum maritimum]